MQKGEVALNLTSYQQRNEKKTERKQGTVNRTDGIVNRFMDSYNGRSDFCKRYRLSGANSWRHCMRGYDSNDCSCHDTLADCKRLL